MCYDGAIQTASSKQPLNAPTKRDPFFWFGSFIRQVLEEERWDSQLGNGGESAKRKIPSVQIHHGQHSALQLATGGCI